MRIAALLILAFGCSGAFAAAPDNRREAPRLLDCSTPPAGIIRIALRSDEDTAEIFEWSNRKIRKVESEPVSDRLIAEFPAASTYKWKYWEISPTEVNRTAVNSNSLLSTPYAMSSDGKTLVAGLQRQNGKIDFEHDVQPSTLVFFGSGHFKSVEYGRA
jgi:hypothetical protein